MSIIKPVIMRVELDDGSHFDIPMTEANRKMIISDIDGFVERVFLPAKRAHEVKEKAN